nr:MULTISPECIES: hypothetical protein [unclassified Microvirga]
MDRHGVGGAFAEAKQHPVGHQGRHGDRQQHRQLAEGPDQRKAGQYPGGGDPVHEKAADRRAQREEGEEARRDQAELGMAQPHFPHDRNSGQTEHRSVGEVDEHEQAEHAHDDPVAGGIRRSIRGRGSWAHLRHPLMHFPHCNGAAATGSVRCIRAEA